LNQDKNQAFFDYLLLNIYMKMEEFYHKFYFRFFKIKFYLSF
jgi:hypothetical protein